jgi:two-component system, cell cycle response regulator
VNEEQTVIRRRAPTTDIHGNEVQAYLIVLSGRSVGKMFKVPMGEVSMGRSLDADIRLEDEGISRMHASVLRNDDGIVMLQDNESTNGTYVNGAKVAEVELSDGDRIQVGSVTILKFSYQDSLEEQFQQQLYESATRDPLTQSYNKRFFMEQLDKDFSHTARHGQALSLVILDVDHFKILNDTHGHPAGDHVLQRMAATIMGALRTEDAFCRIGGEEFAIIMRDCAEEAATQAAERMRVLVQDTRFVYGGTELPVTVSVGVAAFDKAKHATPQDLVEQADRYLYQAKHTGRNRVCASTR